MPDPKGPVLVTGANGHLGRRLITRLCNTGFEDGRPAVRALVRSARALAQVEELRLSRPDGLEIRIVDYTDAPALTEAAKGCRSCVHFVGIIKETRSASYRDAHERTCEVLAEAAAAAGLDRIVYLSIFGSAPDSANTCLASKGRGERILLEGRVPAVVIRVPMVLGPDDHASRALAGQARARLLPLVGGGATLQQPIDSRDVIAAAVSALALDPPLREAIDLGGPECLSQRELVARAARLYGRQPRVLPVPRPLVGAFTSLVERISANPPVTRAMLGVLEHDDRIDVGPALSKLGLELTPLDETLRVYVGPEATRS